MKRMFALVASIFSIISLSSCSKDESHRYIFLSAKYRLTYAAINTTYEVSDNPPYFSHIKGSTNVIDKFDKNESFYIANVEVNNNKPTGYGSVIIKTLENSYSAEFTYYCQYNGVYGGQVIQTNNSKPEFLGKQYCRGHMPGDTFIRTEAYIPEVSSSRLILEFSLVENFDEPVVFDHTIY